MTRYARQNPFSRPTRLALALGLIGTLHAATLGDLQLSSKLGQLLEAKVRISTSKEELIAVECLSAVLREGGEGGSVKRLLLDYTPDKSGGGWISLNSESVVNEPLMQVTLRLRCTDGIDLKREYTLFLDPPGNGGSKPTAQPAPQVDSNPHNLPLAGTRTGTSTVTSQMGGSLYQLARQQYPHQPDARRQFIAEMRKLNPGLPTDGEAALPANTYLEMPAANTPYGNSLADAKGNWTVQSGESFYNIVRRLYPDQPAEKKALVAAMRKLNPQLPRDGEKPLPAGMQLRLPDRLTPAPATPPPQQQPQAFQAPLRATTPAEQPPLGRLQISSATANPAAPSSTEQALTQKEQELLDQAADQMASLHKAEDKIDKLDKRLAWLANELSRRDTEYASEKKRQSNDWTSLGIAALAGAGTAGLLALLLGRSTRRRMPASGEAERLAAALGEEREALLWEESAPSPPPTPVIRRPVAPTPQYESPADGPAASDMDVFILNSAASEAAVLAAHGQYDRAVKLLEDEIEAFPTSLVNWMQLLELYHGHRDAANFLQLAKRFRQRFASEALWSKVRLMGVELLPEEALFSLDNAGFAAPEPTLEAVLDGDAPPIAEHEKTVALAEPLVFELDRSITAIGEPQVLDLIDVPPMRGSSEEADTSTGDNVATSPLERARRLIAGGDREAGAAVLEQILMHGSQDEKLSAADMLVRLTSPS